MNTEPVIIDPEQMADALMEAMGQTPDVKSTLLSLTIERNGSPIKVLIKYKPKGAGAILGYDQGTPITPPGTRVQKYDFGKWFKENVEKMNDISIQNAEIINDMDKKGEPDPTIKAGPGQIKFSLIPWGEFVRLRDLCFPGADIVTPDGEIESNENRGKGRKGNRGGKSSAIGETV